MTGWGQDGPLARARGPRHRLHRALRRAARHRPRGRRARAAAQSGRRFRRRRHAARVRRRAARSLEAQRSGRGPGGRRGDGRRRVAADHDAVGHAGGRDSGRDERGVNVLDSGAPWYDIYATRTAVTSRSARSSPSSTPSCCAPRPRERASLPGAERSRRMAGAARALRHHLRHPHARRWCEIVRRRRRMLRAGADVRRGRRAPARRRRHAHVTVANVAQPAPAPRFSRTSGAVRGPPPERGAGGREALADWGFSAADVERLASQGLGFQ